MMKKKIMVTQEEAYSASHNNRIEHKISPFLRALKAMDYTVEWSIRVNLQAVILVHVPVYHDFPPFHRPVIKSLEMTKSGGHKRYLIMTSYLYILVRDNS